MLTFALDLFSARSILLACSLLTLVGCGSAPPHLTSPVVPLEIALQPASASTPLGSTATFTVRAGGGTGTLSYQWSKNGSAIPGATSTSYVTAAVALADTGSEYTVTVSDQETSVVSAKATLTVAARSPMSADLRFQLVASPAAANGTYDGLSLGVLYPYIFTYPTALGTPLQLGLGECVPGVAQDCQWAYRIHDLPPGVSLSVVYLSDILENLDAELNKIPSTTVVTSLDIESGEDVFGLSTQTGQSNGFDVRHETAALTALEAGVAADGVAGRVVTAVSFNDATGSVDFLSYGWASDTTTIYDTQVSTVPYDNIGPAATALANSGFIITAFGGNGPDGYILIGTKVHGDTLPRSLLVSPDANVSLSGYALVGWALNDPYLSNGSPPIWLFER